MVDSISILLRFTAGGLLVVLVTLLADRHPTLAGVLVFFPAVSIASLLFLGHLPPQSLRDVVGGMLLGLVPLAGFIAGAYLGAGRGVVWAVILGLVFWLAAAVFLAR